MSNGFFTVKYLNKIPFIIFTIKNISKIKLFCIKIFNLRIINNTYLKLNKLEAKKRRVSKDFFNRELGQVEASAKRITEDGLGAFYLN